METSLMLTYSHMNITATATIIKTRLYNNNIRTQQNDDQYEDLEKLQARFSHPLPALQELHQCHA